MTKLLIVQFEKTKVMFISNKCMTQDTLSYTLMEIQGEITNHNGVFMDDLFLFIIMKTTSAIKICGLVN
jgi:hypothetical protein